MVFHSFDENTGHAWTWNGDFHYDGILSAPLPESIIVGNDINAEYFGCYFLSGLRNTAYVFHTDGVNPKLKIIGNPRSQKEPPYCYCGSISGKPDELAKQSIGLDARSVYVCPLIDELASFGALASAVMLAGYDNPRRANLYFPNKDIFPNRENDEFDENLDGEGLGRMARIIGTGMPVLNQYRKPVGVSPFYGKVLMNRAAMESPHAFVMSNRACAKYFPTSSIALRLMATCVPVQMQNTLAFMQASGCQDNKVNVSLSSDFNPDMRLFLEYMEVTNKQDFVVTYDASRFDVSLIRLIRFNRCYL